MSNYGDFEFARAETAYRIERNRTAPWIADTARAVRRRVTRRRDDDSLDPRGDYVA
jgi:hypothetical protein